MSAYAELAVTTNFSFLRGASHPGEMVARADELKLAAIGIADRNSFAGVVRAYDEGKDEDHKTSRRHAARHRGRLRGADLSDRSASLWAALPASDGGQSQGQERRMPSDLRADSGCRRRPDFYRVAAGGAFARSHRRASSCFWLAQRRAAPSSPASIITAATSRAGSACWPSSASGTARRSSPSTTCIITRRSAGRSSTSSPASARNALFRSRLPARRQCRAAS